MVKNSPIGIFDSGLGGLTVARAIIDQLPNEELLYIGDTAHTPYGDKNLGEVRKLSLDLMDELVSHQVKMLVIACNTASASVLDEARERYQVPVIEVIEPAVRRALGATHNRKIGVLGTTATINSGAYQQAFNHQIQTKGYAPAEITAQAAPRFVEFVESGKTAGAEVIAAAKEYLAPMLKAQVDTLVLGCTHYPMLQGAISYVMGPEVNLVTSSEETAIDVYRKLKDLNLVRDDSAKARHVFAETAPRAGKSSNFVNLANRFLGPITHTTTIPVQVK